MKNKVEIFEDENSVIVDSEYDIKDFVVFPESKKFTITSRIKDDAHNNYLTCEYKISTTPIALHTRLLEKSYEPPFPREYEVRDGVVLKSEITKAEYVVNPNILEDLKKEVEWSEVSLFGNLEVNLYILSKHPEIISKDEYRRFLRQSIERIKVGTSKVKEVVEKNTHGLKIHTSDYGMSIWYENNELERKESQEYWNLPKDMRDDSSYGKKLKYVEDFNESLFSEKSLSYLGISSAEFVDSHKIVEYIQKITRQER